MAMSIERLSIEAADGGSYLQRANLLFQFLFILNVCLIELSSNICLN